MQPEQDAGRGSEANWREPGRDHLLWAKRLKKRHEQGEKLLPIQIDSYRAALGIKDVTVVV